MNKQFSKYIFIMAILLFRNLDLNACSQTMVTNPDIIVNFSKDSQVRIYDDGVNRTDQIVISIFKNSKLIKSFTLSEICGLDLYMADHHLMTGALGCGSNFSWNPRSILKANNNVLSLSAECGNIKIDLMEAKLIQRADSSWNPFHKIWGFFVNLFIQNFGVSIFIVSSLIILLIICLILFIGKKIYSRFRR